MVQVEHGLTNACRRKFSQDSFGDRDPRDGDSALSTDQRQGTKPGRVAGGQQECWQHRRERAETTLASSRCASAELVTGCRLTSMITSPGCSPARAAALLASTSTTSAPRV